MKQNIYDNLNTDMSGDLNNNYNILLDAIAKRMDASCHKFISIEHSLITASGLCLVRLTFLFILLLSYTQGIKLYT